MTPFGWLAAANFAFGLAFGIYGTIFFPFITEDLGISPSQLGLLESVREIPGLLTVGMAALVMTVVEPVVGAVALLLLGVGYLNYFHVDGIPSLIVFSLVTSVGFHMWMPISSTLALRLSRVSEQGSRLGQLRAVAAVANLAGIGFVALVAGVGGLRPLFVVAGAISDRGGTARAARARSTAHPASTANLDSASLLALLRAVLPRRRAPPHLHDVCPVPAGA